VDILLRCDTQYQDSSGPHIDSNKSKYSISTLMLKRPVRYKIL